MPWVYLELMYKIIKEEILFLGKIKFSSYNARTRVIIIYDREHSSITSVLRGVDCCFNMMPFLQGQWRKVVIQLNLVENLSKLALFLSRFVHYK